MVDTYISQQKKQLLDSLENQVRFSQLVAVIVGEKGIGKSFLLNQLQSRLDEEVAIATIDASLAMNESQLEKTISLQLGLSWQSSELSLEQKIKNDLTQKVLITIDNAHLLSKSCIDFILKLNQSQLAFQESVLFILLVGKNSLPNIISKTDTYIQHQDMCVVFQIEAIKKNEIQSIVESFGHFNVDITNELHKDKKLDYFWQLSKGNPAELNYHLSRWLEEHSSKKVVEITDKEPSSHLKSIVYAVIAVALIAVLFFQNEINSWISADQSVNTDDEKNRNNIEDKDEVLSTDSNTSNKKKIVEDISKQVSTKQYEPQEITQKKAIPIESKSQVSDTRKNKKETKLKDVEVSSIAEPKGEDDLSEKTRTVEKASIKKVNIDDTPKVASTLDEQSLLSKNSSYFALQWVGLSQLKAALEYKNKHPLSADMRIYRRVNGDKALFLIVSDYYPTRAEADLGKNDYLKRGYTGKPWVKSIAAIQSEIKAFQSLQASGKIR